MAAAIASTVQNGRSLMPFSFQRRRDRFVIAERQYPVADDLAGFVALAGNQQHVARAQFRHRRADRLAAVADLARAGRRGQDRRADRGGIFAARIVVGDDDAVGLLARRWRPSSAACPDRGRRRRRTRPPAAAVT